MPFAVQVKIAGLDSAFAQLAALERRISGPILRKAMRAGAHVILLAARRTVPVEIGRDQLSRARSGIMKRSLGIKVKAYRARGIVVAIVGARRGFRKQIGVRTRGKHKGSPVFYDPTKVFHLVERGGRGIRARAPLRRAMDQTKVAAGQRIADVIQQEIIKKS